MSNKIFPNTASELSLDEPLPCGECGALLLYDGTCLRCAPPVMFQAEWLESRREELRREGHDIVPLQFHERVKN